MYGALFKNTAKNKEYRFNEISSLYLNSFSQASREFLPASPENAPTVFQPIGSQRVDGVSNAFYNIYPALPAYLTLLGYTDFISLVTEYYDWVYTSNTTNSQGSGYFLTSEDVYRLLDINSIAKTSTDDRDFIYDKKLRKDNLSLIASQYAEGLETYWNDPSNPITEDQLIQFISGIRENFYQKKTNKAALDYYFRTLFEVVGASVIVDEPKKYILRTDGGIPEFAPNASGNLLISDQPLGQAVFQDSYWYQDYSYLLSVSTALGEAVGLDLTYDLDEVEQEIYSELAHPAGIKVFFNTTNDDYIPPPDFDGEFGARETTILGHYLPYRLFDQTGLTYTAGCTFDLDGDGTSLTTHAHPGWSNDIPVEGSAAAAFGNINIGSFFFLAPAENSPNTSYTPCS